MMGKLDVATNEGRVKYMLVEYCSYPNLVNRVEVKVINKSKETFGVGISVIGGIKLRYPISIMTLSK